ncbi:hypothetical protein SG34_031950 [Thalassomonas viridans]|uniref:Uncharacterized protein n=1 Tax=Thalassomonas viridans TaxID=137584 RepID=A0AAE9Z8M8_9GAMM|nr:hypothetical protein [Thalassomonas viridans]WDE08538.1 hypothetical protein SG34_031950 [Thalassomonas viridans]
MQSQARADFRKQNQQPCVRDGSLAPQELVISYLIKNPAGLETVDMFVQGSMLEIGQLIQARVSFQGCNGCSELIAVEYNIIRQQIMLAELRFMVG